MILLIIFTVLVTTGALIELRRDRRTYQRLADPTPTQLEQFREDMERFITATEMEAELEAIFREIEG